MSLFSNTAEQKTKKLHEEQILEEFRQYTYENLTPYERECSPWKKGKIWTKHNNIYVDGCGNDCFLTIKGLRKKPGFKISEIKGYQVSYNKRSTFWSPVARDIEEKEGHVVVSVRDSSLKVLAKCFTQHCKIRQVICTGGAGNYDIWL